MAFERKENWPKSMFSKFTCGFVGKGVFVKVFYQTANRVDKVIWLRN